MHFKFDLFPLLVSGVRVGRLCWVGQEPAVVIAVVWNYFSCHCLLAGNRPAICMGSAVVVSVLGSLRLGDG